MRLPKSIESRHVSLERAGVCGWQQNLPGYKSREDEAMGNLKI